MDKVMNTVRELQTTKNFESFLNFTNPSNCDYFSYRMTKLDIDITNYQITLEKVKKNITRLYQDSRDVYWNFGVYFRTLENYWTRQVTVFNVMKSFWTVYKEYFEFSGLIKANLIFSKSLLNFLNTTYQNANCPSVTSILKPKGDLIESDLIKTLNELVALELIALQKVRDSLKVVASTAASSSDSPTRLNFIKLEFAFEEQSTVDDYPNLMWPRIPDSSDKGDNGFYIKIKTCQSKTQLYNNVDENIKTNKSRIQSIFNSLSQTVTSSKNRKVRAVSPAVNDVLTATLGVLNKFTEYSAKVVNAILQVNQFVKAEPTPCGHSLNVSDSKGNYIKTACMIKAQQNYKTAQSTCQSYNMPSLYSISTADDYEGIKTFATQVSMLLFSATVDKRYAIAGDQMSDGNWFNKNPLMTPLLNSAISPYCLFIEGFTGVLRFSGHGCYSRFHHGLCEFNKNTQTPTNCATTQDILGPGSVYIKTVCTMAQNVDPITQHQNCKNNGMSGLYTMTNQDEVDGIKAYVTSLGPIGGIYEIGGQQWTDMKWIYPDGQNFFIGKPDFIATGCLVIEGFPSGFATKSVACTDANWFICEFKY